MPRKPYYFYGWKPLKEYCYEEGLSQKTDQNKDEYKTTRT